MVVITGVKKQGSWAMLDSRIVKSLLTRNDVDFTNFKEKFNNCEFLVEEDVVNTEAFYKTCVVLDAAYSIVLSSSHRSMLTIESMRKELADMLFE